MKNHIKILFIGLLLCILACKSFDKVNTDTESTTKVTSAMIATRIIINLANQPSQKGFLQPYMLNKSIVWTEFADAYQYNALGAASLSFTGLNDAHMMGEFAGTEVESHSYNGLMYFARAVKFYEASMNMGDIPYAKALQGETEKEYFPEYDLQKDVFLGILKELETADQFFAKGARFAGDPIYNGDPASWRRLVNSYSLKVLMHLSKKEQDADLEIKSRFQKILATKPLFTSNAHNYQLIRSDRSGQTYPFYKVGNNFTIYPILSDEIVDRLKALADRRLFYYAAPSPLKLESGFRSSDFEAYVGIDPALVYESIIALKGRGDYSSLNPRYTELAAGEPTQQFSYAQLCFIVAEAALRGWVDESVADWYKKGIRAAMDFVFEHTPNTEQFHHNNPLDAEYIEAYAAAQALALPIDLEEAVRAIITQKYLASFLQSTFETYYDYRRTGYPSWKINSESNLNVKERTKIPMRWKYPDREFRYNAQHVATAVKRQFDGDDEVNKLMWILK